MAKPKQSNKAKRNQKHAKTNDNNYLKIHKSSDEIHTRIIVCVCMYVWMDVYISTNLSNPFS